MALCNAIKAQIQESMDVNDAMLGKLPPGRKNQAQAAAQARQTTDRLAAILLHEEHSHEQELPFQD